MDHFTPRADTKPQQQGVLFAVIFSVAAVALSAAILILASHFGGQ